MTWGASGGGVGTGSGSPEAARAAMRDQQDGPPVGGSSGRPGCLRTLVITVVILVGLLIVANLMGIALGPAR